MKSAILAVIVCAAALGQCNNLSGVSFSSYGAGCAPFGVVPILSGSYDPNACAVSLRVQASPVCCNVYLVGRVFALGTSPANVPLPTIGTGCSLLVNPDIAVLEWPSSSGDTLMLQLPSGPPLAGIVVYVQGAARHFDTFCLCSSFQMSNGLAASFF